MAKNYYDVLGIDKKASEKEVRSAYRKLARQYHPDVNPGDKAAEAKFKEINEAYQVLSNEDSRKKYDRYGENWRHADQFERSGSGGGGGQSPFSWFSRARRGSGTTDQRTSSTFGGFGDLFGDLFGTGGGGGVHVEDLSGPQRVEAPVSVTLEEAYHGAKRNVQIPGDPFTGRAAKTLEVSIPAGVRSGSKVHIGASGDGANRLDLYLNVTVSHHKLFERKGDDLLVTVDVPLADLMLGGEAEVPTITGKKVALTVPAETQNGRVFRLKGKGMPSRSSKGAYGDELVTVKAVLPTHLTPEQKELFQRLREPSKAGV